MAPGRLEQATACLTAIKMHDMKMHFHDIFIHLLLTLTITNSFRPSVEAITDHINFRLCFVY